VLRLPLLLVFALALAACGSSNDASTTTGTTTVVSTSMQAYVNAGNKVCMDSDKRIFKLGRLTRSPKGWAKTAAAARTAIAEMRQVKPPPEQAGAFKQMLRFANALALSVQEVHDSLVKSDLDTATAAQFAAAQIQDNVHRTAKAAGLTFCQQALTNWPA
jgi:hypothetical protein